MLSVETTTFDLGNIKIREKYPIEFDLFNDSDKDIKPSLHAGSCTCISISISNPIIKAKTSEKVKIIFTPNSTGNLLRTPYINFSEDNKNKSINFTVKGKVSK